VENFSKIVVALRANRDMITSVERSTKHQGATGTAIISSVYRSWIIDNRLWT